MRTIYLIPTLAAIVATICPPVTEAQQVRQFEKDGIVYQETRSTERKPVANVQLQERRETVYVQQPRTELREYERTVYWPVVKYRCEPRWHNVLNPFGQPYVAYHMRPTVEWQARNERVQTPVTYQQWVPQTRIVTTPVRTLGFANQETVSVARVAPSAPAPLIASRPPATLAPVAPMSVTGRPVPVPPAVGVRRMEGDPPRFPSSSVLR